MERHLWQSFKEKRRERESPVRNSAHLDFLKQRWWLWYAAKLEICWIALTQKRLNTPTSKMPGWLDPEGRFANYLYFSPLSLFIFSTLTISYSLGRKSTFFFFLNNNVSSTDMVNIKSIIKLIYWQGKKYIQLKIHPFLSLFRFPYTW